MRRCLTLTLLLGFILFVHNTEADSSEAGDRESWREWTVPVQADRAGGFSTGKDVCLGGSLPRIVVEL